MTAGHLGRRGWSGQFVMWLIGHSVVVLEDPDLTFFFVPIRTAVLSVNVWYMLDRKALIG